MIMHGQIAYNEWHNLTITDGQISSSNTQLDIENGQCHRMALFEDYGWQNYY